MAVSLALRNLNRHIKGIVMTGCWTFLIIPIVIGVIMLVIEYWVIQPMRVANDHSLSLLTGSANRDWSTAMKTAVKRFRANRGNYLFSLISEHFKIEEAHIEKGRATLTLKCSLIRENK